MYQVDLPLYLAYRTLSLPGKVYVEGSVNIHCRTSESSPVSVIAVFNCA